MDPFWTFARRMLRYKGLLGAALVMAVVSASSLGAGILGVGPVLEQIVGTADGEARKGLPELAEDFNRRSKRVQIPGSVISRLPEGPFTAACWIVGALAALTIFGAVCNFLHAYFSLTIVNLTMTNIRREAFHKVVRLPLKDVVTDGASDAISRIINDTAALSSGFNALLSKAVSQVSKGAAAGIAAIVIDWRLTIVGAVVGVGLGAILKKTGTRIRRASRAAMVSQADLYSAALEAVQGLRVVKVHTTERFEAGRFHRINRAVMREMNRVRTARALASPLVEVLALFVLGGLTLVAVKAVIDNQLSPGKFILTLAALGVAAASFKPLTGILNDIQSSAASADRLRELMGRTEEPGHNFKLPKLARHAKSIEFANVTFAYPRQERPALDGISLELPHGSRIAVVGPNGSGKTTLLSLVPRLFDPQRGRVLIDGVDISTVSVRSLRRQIGVVTQETVLFRGTIASNIAYGAGADEAGGVTREKIVEAAKRARADEFIRATPKGYDTEVGEQGLTLSGGQRQRIAIARAILRDPAILILDEATSMIDADSEAKIGAALEEFASGRTSLIVAHRLSTVVGADLIVVMDHGKVVDQGTHGELLERCEVYRLIARHQLIAGG
jgi:ATP-binding cassette, subfamily B, bacterial MsbA